MENSFSSSYFQLLLKKVARLDEEVITDLCFGYGASGVSEDLDFLQESLQYEPVTVDKPFISLNIFFESAPDKELLDQIKKKWPEIEVTLSEEPNKDWNEEWKKGFEEFELVKGIWVVPSWRQEPAGAKKVLSIDPGMAFGTGTHETTRLASQALYEISRTWQKGLRVLDVGTGTGILSMLALELGAAQIMATEIDPVARDVARENIRNNDMQQLITVSDHQVESISEKFPLVMANIIDGVLVSIQEPLKNCLAPGGVLLLTGILEEREAYFRENFQLPEDYHWQKRWTMEEWVALLGAPQ